MSDTNQTDQAKLAAEAKAAEEAKAKAQAEAKAKAEAESKTSQPAAEAAPEAPKVFVPELGKTVRVAAVFGRTIHPFTQDEFEVDGNKKVTVDTWIQVQFEGGKLRLASQD